MRFIVVTVPKVPSSQDLGSSSQREGWVAKLKSAIPELEICPAINGFDPKSVDESIVSSGLKFRQLYFPNYGTLASWISKYLCIKEQVESGTDYLCFMEDDFSVNSDFVELAAWAAKRFEVQPQLNYITFANYSEAYLTSLAGAKRLLSYFEKDGVADNFDNQMTRYEPWVRVPVPHKILAMVNGGAIKLTDKLPQDYSFSVSFQQGAKSSLPKQSKKQTPSNS